MVIRCSGVPRSRHQLIFQGMDISIKDAAQQLTVGLSSQSVPNAATYLRNVFSFVSTETILHCYCCGLLM